MTIHSLIVSYVLLSIFHITLSNVYVYDNSNKLIKDFDDQSASFGPSFPSDGLKGYVATTHPENGCKKLSPPPNIATFGYRWIALIPRTRGNDSCEFALKVQNAQNANFSAVIIYNYEDAIITMGSSSKNVRIPSTLITRTNGLILLGHYLYNQTSTNNTPIYHVKIIGETLSMTAYLIPLSVVVSLLLLGLLGFTLVKCYVHRRHVRRHRLPRSALKHLKTKKFVKGDPWEVCAVCLDDYEEGAKLRILPCDHAYHMKCIDPWLIDSRRQCPVCKRYVFPNHDNSDEEDGATHQPARTLTEQTPLVVSNDDNSTTMPSRNRQLPERRLNDLSGRGVHNVSFAINESSDSVETLSTLPRPTSTNQSITMGVNFDRPSLNSRRYGSINDSSITPRVANFFVDSIGDTTHESAHSILEDVSDIEVINDDGDGRVHPTTTYSEENPAFINDEGSATNALHTHL